MIPVTQSLPPNRPAADEIHSILDAGPTVNAPWRYAALAQIRTLEENGRNYPGMGDLRLTDATASHARQLLAQFDIGDAPTPVVVSISGGGLAVSWNVGRREIQLCVFPDGDAVYLKTEGGAIIDHDVEGPLDREQLTAGLKWLMGRES